MDIAFNAIGLDVSSKKAFHAIAKDAQQRGELSRLPRKSGVLHGCCWRLGEGLEVWTVLYESTAGEISQAGCRPGFRARFRKKINPWIMTEFDEEGEAVVHGFVEDSDAEVLFELQNITEASEKSFAGKTLTVGLCGLAYKAEVFQQTKKNFWKPLKNSRNKNENDWSLCGEIIAFRSLSNPFSGNDLYWVHVDLGDFDLEVLINHRSLRGDKLSVGSTLKADVWLQGHILSESANRLKGYEGVDLSVRSADFWKRFKRLN